MVGSTAARRFNILRTARVARLGIVRTTCTVALHAREMAYWLSQLYVVKRDMLSTLIM